MTIDFIDYDGLVAAIKARVIETRLTYSMLDELVGVAPGMTGKLLGDSHVRKFGVETLMGYTQVLAMRFHFAEDPALAEQMRPLWETREGPIKNYAPRVPRIGQATIRNVLPAVAREMGRRGLAKSLATVGQAERGRKGGLARAKILPSAERSNIARIAGCARQAKWRAKRQLSQV